MKSPAKQDFIEGNQEEDFIQRKIRVKILDPDATESSDDDDEQQEKRPKYIVHEIIQEKVKIQSFSINNGTPFDFYQFSGKLSLMVRKRKCGKLGTEEKLKVSIFAKSENGSSGDLPLMADSQTSD
ncbi:hypothetical protein P3S68_033080 [Capsicum galapagoense]